MNRYAYTRLLLVLSCAFGFLAATQAAELGIAEPGPQLSADPQIAALEQALTNAARRMAQARAAAPPQKPVVSQTDLSLTAALLAVTALAALKFAPRIKRRFSSWMPKPNTAADLASCLLEEPSVVAFFEALRTGPAAPSDCAIAAANPRQEFCDSAPRHLAELRKLLSEIGRTPDDDARREKLLESFHHASALRERAGLPELLPVWQVALALEELLKQLLRKASNVTPSVLRTVAGALDLLRDLGSRRVRPNLATEPPVRLLAVDDDPICRRAVAFALAKAFREPDLAADGEAAVALATQRPYDAIFLDVEMPGIDGFDVCSRIHETELNRTTPVVFVTGHNDFESRAQATVLGAQAFIAKPFLVFEITLKALTMGLRARLDRSAAEPDSVSKWEAASTAAAAPGFPAAANSEAIALPDRPCLSAGRDMTPPSGSTTDDSGSGVAGMLSTAPSAPAAGEAGPSCKPSPGPLSSPTQPTRHELTHAFFTHAPAQIETLRAQLATAREAAPDRLGELLSDLYLDSHRLCSDAHRAQLKAALRLASALEAMLKKLFDYPKLCVPSTLDAAAGALDVFDELCRAGTDPDLMSPAARIMVVDDDPVACRAIAVSLQLVFGRPDSADSGEAALVLAAKRRFDLIFLDVRMPGMDGFSACAQIHATPLNRLTPVIFVTSHNDTVSRAQGAAAGGCGYIPKPVLASQIALVALSYLLQGRLGWQIPPSESPPSRSGSSPEPASPARASTEKPPLASAAGVAI